MGTDTCRSSRSKRPTQFSRSSIPALIHRGPTSDFILALAPETPPFRARMAKSVLDAGWSMFREQLRYKALRHGVAFEVIRQKKTIHTFSECGSIGGPKGIASL